MPPSALVAEPPVTSIAPLSTWISVSSTAPATQRSETPVHDERAEVSYHLSGMRAATCNCAAASVYWVYTCARVPADEQRHHLDANCHLDDGKGHARTIATLIDEQHAIIAEGSRSEHLTSERTSERQDVAPPVASVAPPPQTATTVEDDPPKRMSVKDRLAMFGG